MRLQSMKITMKYKKGITLVSSDVYKMQQVPDLIDFPAHNTTIVCFLNSISRYAVHLILLLAPPRLVCLFSWKIFQK